MKLVLLVFCTFCCPYWAIGEGLATTEFPASEIIDKLNDESSQRPLNVDSRARILIGSDDETPLAASSGSNVLKASNPASPGDDWTPIVWPTTRLPERRVTQVSPASTQIVRPTTSVPRRPLPIVLAAPARASTVGQLSTFIAPTSVRTVSIPTLTPPTVIQFDLEDAGILPVTTGNTSESSPSSTQSASSIVFQEDSLGAESASGVPMSPDQFKGAVLSAVESPSESASSEKPTGAVLFDTDEADETTQLIDSPSETSIAGSIDDLSFIAAESDRRNSDSPSSEDSFFEDTTISGTGIEDVTEFFPDETNNNPDAINFAHSTPELPEMFTKPTSPSTSDPPTASSVLSTSTTDPTVPNAAVIVSEIPLQNSSLADIQTVTQSTPPAKPVETVTSPTPVDTTTEETGRGTLLSTIISVLASTLSSTTPLTVTTPTTPTSDEIPTTPAITSTAIATSTTPLSTTASTTETSTTETSTTTSTATASTSPANTTPASTTPASTAPASTTQASTKPAKTTPASTTATTSTTTSTTVPTSLKTTTAPPPPPTTIQTFTQNVQDFSEGSSNWAVTEGSSTTSIPDSDATVIAVTVSVAAVLCLALLILLLFVIRRRRARAVQGTCQPARMDAYSMENVSPSNTWQRGKLRSTLRASKRSYLNQAFEDPTAFSMQLTAAQLALYMEKPISNIEAEFSRIPNSSTVRIEELPVGVESKNRYANVLPIPETRVKIGLTEEQQQSPSVDDDLKHYINANFVRGPKEESHYYIACQGPLESTVADFWQMIWENQSKIIIQLTDLSENGVVRCAEYLPPSEVLDCHRLYGDYQVTLKSRELRDNYITSYIQLKRMEDNLVRDITHLWYSSWPVTGVPNQVRTIVTMLLEARKGQLKEQPGPIVVHCSPGTGRTGTALAIDICLRQLDSTRSIDIPRCVYRLRQDRFGCVQTKEQYAFIYKAVNYYASQLSNAALDSL